MSQENEQPDSDQSTDVAVPEPQSAPSPADQLAVFGVTIPSTAPVKQANHTLTGMGGTVTFTLDVARIDSAERLYHELFEMDIICRAWRQDDGSWEVTTEEIDWNACLINGYYPELVVLQRPRWQIILHGMGRGEVLKSPKIGDAFVPVSLKTLRRLRAKILMKSYTVVQDYPDQFAFRGPFAVVWTLT
ncbi:MAG: hypothetical protein WD401_05945, partial [Thermomicrobiaceae bacterium]